MNLQAAAKRRLARTPPQSEQPGRGVNAKYEPAYHRIGNTNQYVAPGGLMKVGFGRRVPNSPPQSEQPGRGVNSKPGLFETIGRSTRRRK